jgi:uncharacterized protein with HEPN domain
MTPPEVLRVQDYLEHILHAINRINRYVAGMDHAAFSVNEEKQDAVIRNIEIIGEAAQHIMRKYPEFAANHPELPWGSAYGMRNVIVHGYFNVELDIVWKTVQNDLPRLAQQVSSLLARDPPPSALRS